MRLEQIAGSRFFVFPLAFWICLLILVSGCRKEQPAPPHHPPAVTALTVVRRDVPVIFEFIAQTQSAHMVNIHARVNGFLEKHLFTEGSLVREGQVLFLMDPKPFQAQLRQTEAALAMQKATLETARADLARTRPLAELNALSQKDLDDATGRFESAAAAVEQSLAQVEAARLNLSYTTITSPITGIAGAALQSDGTYISTQNSQLTTITAISPMWVNFSISENQIQTMAGQIRKGQIREPAGKKYAVEIVLVDGTIYPHTGIITFADPAFNSRTGTFLIRASVENPAGALRPNQYVRARLKGAVRPEAVLLPQRAVQQGSRGHFVWVMNPDDTVEQRPVIIGEWHENDWFIFEGLESGEQVVTDGTMMLHPGMKVVPTRNTASSEPMSGSPPAKAPSSRHSQ